MIWFEKSDPKWKEKAELTTNEKEIQIYLKSHNKEGLTRTDINSWTDIEISNQPNSSSTPTNWPLVISLTIGGIVVLGIIIFWLVKKINKK